MTAVSVSAREADFSLASCDVQGLRLAGRAFRAGSHGLNDGPDTARALLEGVAADTVERAFGGASAGLGPD